MTNWNCHPDMHTYSSLIMCACEDKEDGLAVLQRVWNDLIASGDLPNVYCFNLLLRYYMFLPVSYTHLTLPTNREV